MTRPAESSVRSDALGVRVASVGDPDATREVLLFMGMLAQIDAVEMRRCMLLAQHWRARITLADFPGCRSGSSGLSREERMDLRRGDFSSVARRMVRSAMGVNPRLQRTRVTLVGYSLGASLAAAAAADAGLLRVDQLTLVEPVAARRRNPIQLLRAVRAEDRAAESNPAQVLPTIRNQAARTDLALVGYSLSRGRLVEDVVRASHYQDFSVQLVHGQDSQLCPTSDAQRVLRILRNKGIDAIDLSQPGRHGFWHNPVDVSTMARAAAQQWSDSARWRGTECCSKQGRVPLLGSTSELVE